MYQGEVKVEQRYLQSFLNTAEELKVKGLYDEQEDSGIENTRVNNSEENSAVSDDSEFPPTHFLQLDSSSTHPPPPQSGSSQEEGFVCQTCHQVLQGRFKIEMVKIYNIYSVDSLIFSFRGKYQISPGDLRVPPAKLAIVNTDFFLLHSFFILQGYPGRLFLYYFIF